MEPNRKVRPTATRLRWPCAIKTTRYRFCQIAHQVTVRSSFPLFVICAKILMSTTELSWRLFFSCFVPCLTSPIPPITYMERPRNQDRRRRAERVGAREEWDCEGVWGWSSDLTRPDLTWPEDGSSWWCWWEGEGEGRDVILKTNKYVCIILTDQCSTQQILEWM